MTHSQSAYDQRDWIISIYIYMNVYRRCGFLRALLSDVYDGHYICALVGT